IMDPEKFIELQKQMRENNEEVADFLKDFSSWKETVEAKDARLQNKTVDTDSLPAVRNSLLRKQKKKRKKVEPTPKTSASRIKGYDYRAWDKFDVDKALNEVEDDIKTTVSESSSTDEELENSRRINLSKEARDLGNLRFKEGNYVDAVEQYTTAVRLTPEDPVPLTNRAFAHLKLERYASAEADCSAALALDSKCIKALFRRALARKNLGKTDEAICDLECILQLDPDNKATVKELSSLTGKTVAKPKADSTQTASLVSTDHKRLDRGARRFRRIPIVEVGGHFNTKQGPSAYEEKGGILKGSCRPVGDTPLETFSSPPILDSLPKERARAHPMNHHDPSVPTSGLKVHLTANGPSNWFQLERELRELCGRARDALPKAAVEYLCRIDPTQYENVIGSNLETSFLTQMLLALTENNVLPPAEIALRLDHLCRLPRFDVAWMMVDDCGRDLLNRLVLLLQQSDAVPREKLNHIRTRFSEL
ncbi:RNA polymerase II-associated protein 3, partial [Clonorchis sinensis]